MYGDYHKKAEAVKATTFAEYRNGNHSSWNNGTVIGQKFNEVTGDKNPNYKDLISSGGNATSRLEAVNYSFAAVMDPVLVTRPTIDGDYWENSTLIYLSDPDNTSFLLNSNDINITESEVLTSFSNFVRKQQTPFQAQVFLGESREILQLLRDPFKGLLKVVNGFTSKRKKLRKGSKAIADLWLETRFAVLPLMSDVNSILDIFLGDVNRRNRDRFFGRTSKVLSNDYLTESMTINGRASYHYEDKYEVFLKCGVLFEKIDRHDDLSNYLHSSLLDISNVAVTAYELTPWSFLVDYFTNVGDIISAASLAGININYTSVSRVRTQTITSKNIAGTHAVNAPYFVISSGYVNQEAFATVTKRTVSRSILSGTIPPLTFEIPSSGVKLANISALIASKLL